MGDTFYTAACLWKRYHSEHIWTLEGLLAVLLLFKGDADHKSSYLYENLTVQTKMAILSRRPILLAILLYDQFLHLTQINLHPNTQLLSYFLLGFCLRHCGMLGEF